MIRRIFAIWTCIFIFVVCIITCFASSCGEESKAQSSYDIEISYNDGVINGRENFTFYNNTDNSFHELKFNLFANAYREKAKYSPVTATEKNKVYYDGESFGNIEINGVFDDDNSLKYEITGEDENILTVSLNKEVFPEEETKIQIEYTMQIAKVISRTGITEHTVNLTNFYPILCGIDNGSFYECLYYSNGDPYFSDIADYKVSIITSDEYIIASSGQLKEYNTYDGKSKSLYEINNARSFNLVLSKEYEILTDNSLGIEINYYYYDDKKPTESLKTAVESIKYYSETFGEYAYEKYSVCQTGFNEGGMEYTALVYISDELEEKAYKEVIIHESAHQWWQVAVGNNEVEEGYLDEGLTEYSVVLFYESHPEYGYSRKNLIEASEKTYKTFCSVSDKLFGKVNTVMKRSLGEFNGEYEYVNICYVKPCIMYEELRSSIGDERFFDGLKRYYKEYKYKNAKTENLIASFERTGIDIQSFFDSFLDGKVII